MAFIMLHLSKNRIERSEKMNIYRLVNIICGSLGVCVIIFGALVGMGMIGNVPPNKAVVLFLLGGIIVLWAVISSRRHR